MIGRESVARRIFLLRLEALSLSKLCWLNSLHPWFEAIAKNAVLPQLLLPDG